ncbi:hypothetical protein [Winogradskyella immobilis]|uniref:Uncharacterized protein n=1 Tax=Winogradskyella immobilis TaxID=2816852 RepID=A0ABS8EMT0_9FLAO|nr:hypothetical protein [Winogradskyella immobilis]MCC1484523.1 hypothetical protein [Winogradskyella immobilis]MCG0016615.1 hypothetical protein [Winogradskyella immobilis]
MGRNDEKLNKFVDQLMANDTLEQPSKDFTDNLMSKIETISTTTTIVYKPLISKMGWIIISTVICLLVGYVIFNEPSGNSKLLEFVDLSKIKNPLANVSFNFSKTLMYTSVLLALMIGVQIPLLKNYFNKRMA